MIQNFWLEISLYPGCVQGFFMAWLLIRKKDTNKEAVQYFNALLITIALLMLLRVTYQPAFFKKFAEIILLPDVILFLTGPLIYFFTRALLRFAPLRSRYLHFLPAAIHVGIVNTFLGLHLNGYLHVLTLRQVFAGFNGIEAGSMLSLSIYLFLSFQLFQQYKNQFYQKYAQPLVIHFLKVFLSAGFVLLLIWAIGFAAKLYLGRPDYTIYTLFWVLLVAAIYFLAYKIWVTPGVLELPNIIQIEEEKPVVEAVTAQEVAVILQYFEREKPYLVPDLKLSDLSKALEIPPYQVSKVINKGFGKNFFDLVNEFRVQEFINRRKSTEYKHLNTLQLAYASGFNSKSAFNRAFLKETGKSPRDYFGEAS